ncbi:YIP1 family protein [Metabacillus idriensis]|uniref:YIP1 family protein n=1 Tax=Metabacillus idriensis TaxID=324768 RepID=UPI001749A890|nr:YIP1 family protein [Metabacillus idriensis]
MSTAEHVIERPSNNPASTHPLGLIQILIKPVEFFSSLRVNRKLGMNILLILAIYGVVSFFLAKYMMQSSEITSILSPELQNGSTYNILYIGTTLLSVVQFIFNVLITTVIFKVILMFSKVGVSFKGLYHIVFIAQVPIIIGKIINLLFIEQGTMDTPVTSLGFTIQNIIESNLIVNLLTNFEIFNLWSLFLIGLGVSVCVGVSRKKSYILVFTTWGIFITLSSIIVTLVN